MANDNVPEQQYEFDGSWSKYQMMVLQQLGDHTQVLQNLNIDVTDHKQSAAVHLAEFAMWKSQVNESLSNLQRSIEEGLSDNKEALRRIAALEHQHNTETQIDLRSKSNWQTTSALIVTLSVIVNLLIQLFVTFAKK